MGFPSNICVENILLEDKNSWLTNIHEVIDFHGGFSTILCFQIKYQMDYTAHKYNIYA